MKPRRIPCAVLLFVCVCAWAGPATAQKRDPLNEKEIDEMRESADMPDKRLEFMVKFARTRMTSIQQLQANGKTAKDRPMQIHDLLEDFTTLLDEMGDNIDMYGSHNADMRKGLTLVIEANSEWQLGMTFERPVDQFVSGPEGMAGCHVLGGVLLSVDGSISSRRTVRTDLADQTRGSVHSRKRRGRTWARKHRQFRAVAEDIAGVAERAGNSSALGGARWHFGCARSGASLGSMRELGQNASRADTILAGQVHEMTIRHSPFAIRLAAGAAS